jgi:hypothetical protein
MFVGGEFYTDESWLLDRPALETGGMLFLNGGTACLILIADYLRDHGIAKVLLPSYLCPSIVTTLEQRGLTCAHYQVNEDLSIDLADAVRKIERPGAFLFINYFGFLHPPRTRAFFQELRASGVIVIEDNAQAGFTPHPSGDFILNSLRKFVPYDGGYLITRRDMTPTLRRYAPRPDSARLAAIRAYRARLGEYLRHGAGEHSDLAALFQEAESAYERDLVVPGDERERAAIERLDWARIRQVRRENYTVLWGLIQSIPELQPIYPAQPGEGIPLGLPVYLNGVPRSRVLNRLARAQIGPLVHWAEIRRPALAAAMARKMLTLPIDQRAGRKEMEYLALLLVRAIETVKEDWRRGK